MHISIYLLICLSYYLSVYLSFCLSVYLSTCFSVYLPICLSVYLSTSLTVLLSDYLSICLSLVLYFSINSFFSLATSPNLCLSFLCLYIFLYRSVSLCLSNCQSVCVHISLFLSISIFISTFFSFSFSFSTSKKWFQTISSEILTLWTCVLRPTWACTFSTSQLQNPQFLTLLTCDVLPATTACTFSTSQLPKVLRTCRVFSILTSKCASTKVLRRWGVLGILTSKCASRHKVVQFFISHLTRWLHTCRFKSEVWFLNFLRWLSHMIPYDYSRSSIWRDATCLDDSASKLIRTYIVNQCTCPAFIPWTAGDSYSSVTKQLLISIGKILMFLLVESQTDPVLYYDPHHLPIFLCIPCGSW